MNTPPISAADREKLTELAARVEAGSADDDELLGAIALGLGWMKSSLTDRAGVPRTLWARPGNYAEDDFSGIVKALPNWPASLDAVVALIEDRLPEIGGNTHGYEVSPVECSAYVSRNNVQSGHWLHESEAKTPARALLAALLKALAAQQQDGATR